MQNLTGRIPNHNEVIESLAQRIAASSARFVLLLEDHMAPYGIEMAVDPSACSYLIDSGFTGLCTEMDKWEIANKQRMAVVQKRNAESLLPHGSGVSHMYGGKIALEFYSRSLLDKIHFGYVKPELNLHSVGDFQTSMLEILNGAHALLYTHSLIIEEFWVKPMRALYGSSVNPLFLFHVVVTNIMNGDEEDGLPAIFEQIKQNILVGNDSIKRAANSLGGIDALKIKLLEEIRIIQELGQQYRIYGASDANVAANIFDAVDGRAIINYGAFHGILDHTPSSLPDQLIAQGLARGQDTSLDIILLMDRQHSQDYYAHMVVDFPIRHSVNVYDVELRQEWRIAEWIEKAPKIYGWSKAQQASLMAGTFPEPT